MKTRTADNRHPLQIDRDLKITAPSPMSARTIPQFPCPSRHSSVGLLDALHHAGPRTRAAPKVMPPVYFQGNYNRYKEHNNTV